MLNHWIRYRPAVALFSIAAIAVAIGVASAVFSLVHTVLVRSLPFRDPARLVWMWNARVERERAPFSLPDLADYRAQNRTLEGLAPFVNWSANLTGSGEAERLEGVRVSSEFFDLLGTVPALGRLPQTGDDAEERVAVLTDGLWRRRFGTDPSIVGTPIVLSGVPYRVVAVLPPGFVFPFRDAEIAVPLPLASSPRRGQRGFGFLRVVARLKPGVTIDAAKRDLDAIGRRLQAQYPIDDAKKTGVNLFALQDEIVGDARAVLRTLLAAAALLVLVAAANVANLLIVALSARRTELQIRAALGASRRRLVTQLAVDTTGIVLCGGIASIAVAAMLVRALAWWGGRMLPRLGSAALEPATIVFAAAATAVVAICCGLLPAWHATANVGSVADDLRAANAPPRDRLRRAFITVQVATSVVLLVAIGLTVRSLLALQHSDPGFGAREVVSIQLSLPPARYNSPAAINAFADALTPRLTQVPGVRSAAAVSLLPLSGFLRTEDYRIVGRAEPPPDAVPQAHYRIVSAGYFRTAAIAVLAGREFSDDDRTDTAHVAVISRTFARQEWGDASPLGAHVRIGDAATPQEVAIVGVVADVKQFGLDAAPTADLYVPLRQMPASEASLNAARTYWIVATSGNPAAAAGAIRREIHGVDGEIATSGVRTLGGVVDDALAPRRFNAALLAAFAQMALLLAAAGVYALAAQAVVQRTRELGVRIALGASRRDIVRLVIASAATPVAAGLAIGVGASFAVGRAIASQLYQVTPEDPATFVTIAALLTIATGIASVLPARRALRVDPLSALRAN